MNRNELLQEVKKQLSALPWWDRPEEDPDLDTVPDDLLLEFLEDLKGEE